MQRSVEQLEEGSRERKRESRALMLSWWQVAVAGLFMIGASVGGAVLVLVFG